MSDIISQLRQRQVPNWTHSTGTAPRQTAKLGDVVSLGNGKFIVIEQGTAPNGKVRNRLMLVEMGSATDISAAGFNPTTSDLEKSSMSGVAVNGASYTTVVAMKKTQLMDLNLAGWLAEARDAIRERKAAG